MTRPLDAALAAQIQSNSISPIFLYDFEFDEGILNFWTGLGTLVWGGVTYTGSANLIDFDLPQETVDLEARGASFTLSGMNDAVQSLAMNTDPRGRSVSVYLGAIDLQTGLMIGEPVQVFGGEMDIFTIEDDPNNSTIMLSAESDAVIFRKIKTRRFTPEDQALDYPDDTGLRFVAAMQDIKIVWGQ